MSNEIQPTRKAIEGEVITEKTPEQAGRELGEAWSKLKQTVSDLSKGFKQVEGKPAPIVIEGRLELYEKQCTDFTEEWYELDDPATSPIQNALETIGKGKRVRVTIEVLEDGD